MLRLGYLILSFLLAGTSHLIADIVYSVTDLGTLGGSTVGSAINNVGQVSGWSETAPGVLHAFLYSDGYMNDLGTLAGSGSMANGINDSGQVTGSFFGPFLERAFLYSNGEMIDLGVLLGSSRGYSVNNLGQVTGISSSSPSVLGHAFLYSSGQIMDLGTLPGDALSVGLAINNAGQVTGYSAPPFSGPARAFLYSDGQTLDLGTLPGYSYSMGHGINDVGQVTGESYTRSTCNPFNAFLFHAFVYSTGQMMDLGTLGGCSSNGLAISNSGQVVGSSDTGSGTLVQPHAFLYSNSEMLDLNSLIDPALAITLTAATAINDHGQIVANSSSSAYLLTPISSAVPEPTNLVLFGIAVLGLAGSSRLRWKRVR